MMTHFWSRTASVGVWFSKSYYISIHKKTAIPSWRGAHKLYTVVLILVQIDRTALAAPFISHYVSWKSDADIKFRRNNYLSGLFERGIGTHQHNSNLYRGSENRKHILCHSTVSGPQHRQLRALPYSWHCLSAAPTAWIVRVWVAGEQLDA